jgi:hypothetical protein
LGLIRYSTTAFYQAVFPRLAVVTFSFLLLANLRMQMASVVLSLLLSLVATAGGLKSQEQSAGLGRHTGKEVNDEEKAKSEMQEYYASLSPVGYGTTVPLDSPEGRKWLHWTHRMQKQFKKAKHWPSDPTGGKTPTEACDCVNWAEAWQRTKVRCGDGFEYFETDKAKISNTTNIEAARNKVEAFHDSAYCNVAFMNFNTTACIQKNKGNEEGSYCYTSSACNKMGGRAQGVDNLFDLAWRPCERTWGDVSLGDLEPPQLARLAELWGIDVYYLAKMAYPTVQDQTWEEVQKYFTGQKHTMDVFAAARAEERSQTGRPTIWPHKSGRVFSITHQNKIFKVSQTLDMKLQTSREGLFEAQERLMKLECVRGCSKDWQDE